MKKSILALLITGAMLGTVHAADGGTYWFNYTSKGEKGDDAICGIRTAFTTVKGRLIKSIHVKYYRSSDTVVVQLNKMSWRIPNGTKIPVTVGFDKEIFGETDGTGSTLRDKKSLDGMIQIPVYGMDAVANFLREFGEADHMWIRFRAGTEPLWIADMTGSRDAALKFVDCVIDTLPSTNDFQSNDTQPFSAPSGKPAHSKVQGEEYF
jgi:hypothetical protein